MVVNNGDNCLRAPRTGIGYNLVRMWVDWRDPKDRGFDIIRAICRGEGRVDKGILWLTVSGTFEHFDSVSGRKDRFVDLECTLHAKDGRIYRHEIKALNNHVKVSNVSVEYI